jgi:hypothetical protein
LGFEYEETETSIKNIDGVETKFIKKMKKVALPDVGACCFLLKNKDKGNWADNPMKIDLEQKAQELKEELERMKMF